MAAGQNGHMDIIIVQTPKSHKNYEGPSTGMDSTVLVEGFNSSITDYGLKYKFMIGDVDSSVYVRILQNLTYGR